MSNRNCRTPRRTTNAQPKAAAHNGHGSATMGPKHPCGSADGFACGSERPIRWEGPRRSRRFPGEGGQTFAPLGGTHRVRRLARRPVAHFSGGKRLSPDSLPQSGEGLSRLKHSTRRRWSTISKTTISCMATARCISKFGVSRRHQRHDLLDWPGLPLRRDPHRFQSNSEFGGRVKVTEGRGAPSCERDSMPSDFTPGQGAENLHFGKRRLRSRSHDRFAISQPADRYVKPISKSCAQTWASRSRS